jgi:hypothetical protein
MRINFGLLANRTRRAADAVPSAPRATPTGGGPARCRPPAPAAPHRRRCPALCRVRGRPDADHRDRLAHRHAAGSVMTRSVPRPLPIATAPLRPLPPRVARAPVRHDFHPPDRCLSSSAAPTTRPCVAVTLARRGQKSPHPTPARSAVQFLEGVIPSRSVSVNRVYPH